MLAQFVQNLVHLECGKDRLDQHGRFDGAARNPELVLCHDKDVVPEPRLEMAFELGKIEIGAAAARDELFRVVEEIQSEVEDPAAYELAVDLHVLFRQMPAARPDE